MNGLLVNDAQLSFSRVAFLNQKDVALADNHGVGDRRITETSRGRTFYSTAVNQCLRQQFRVVREWSRRRSGVCDSHRVAEAREDRSQVCQHVKAAYFEAGRCCQSSRLLVILVYSTQRCTGC